METYRSDFGRTEVPGQTIPTRNLRRYKHNRKALFHRVKNGVYDPITFYHITDALLQIKAWNTFRANELVELLGKRAPNIVWDSVSVGRILNDMAESFDAKDMTVIRRVRRWNGVTYEISDHTEHRRALMDLMEDLEDLSNREMTYEATQGRSKRTESPLLHCPSLRVSVS
jgi:hypothetical protein